MNGWPKHTDAGQVWTERKPNVNQRARCTSRGSPVLQNVGPGMLASADRVVKWNSVAVDRCDVVVSRLESRRASRD